MFSTPKPIVLVVCSYFLQYTLLISMDFTTFTQRDKAFFGEVQELELTSKPDEETSKTSGQKINKSKNNNSSSGFNLAQKLALSQDSIPSLATFLTLIAGAGTLYKLTAAERVTPDSFRNLSNLEKEKIWPELPSESQKAIYKTLYKTLYKQSSEDIPNYVKVFADARESKHKVSKLAFSSDLIDSSGEQFYRFLDPERYKQNIVKPIASFSMFADANKISFENFEESWPKAILEGIALYNKRHAHYKSCDRCQINQHDLCFSKDKYQSYKDHTEQCKECQNEPLLTCKKSVVALTLCEKTIPEFLLGKPEVLNQLLEFYITNPDQVTPLTDRLSFPWKILRKVEDSESISYISYLDRKDQRDYLNTMSGVYLARGLGWAKPD